jgi:hypothetical protein
MKGQVTMEELVSLSVYLAVLSLLIASAIGMKGAGEEWGERVALRAEAGSLARAHDAFHSCNVYGPYNWSGGGMGYLELERGGVEATAPVLAGRVEVAEGEPV